MNVQKKGNWLLFEAPKSWSGLSLEQAFQTKWFVPKKMLHEWRMTKGVAINDNIVPFHTIISPNDRIRVRIKEEQIEPTPTYAPLHIVFEDDHVLVVNKRAHIDVHPTQPNQTNTLANAVAFHFQCEGIYSKVRHIHRLDRDTSGVILFAKHALAGAILDQYLAKRTIRRTYIALVHGYVKQKKGTIEAPIGRDRHHPTRRRVSKTGDTAITHYERLQYDKQKHVSLVRLTLDTGRTHQIRVHMSYIGHPLVGDTLYGGKPWIDRQALHAFSLSFLHPFTGERITCSALPDETIFGHIKRGTLL
ncbi:RluA family pseudouridine synthase [Anoxybacillus sp. LAT_35]|uniref:RluA family pseudouridine synthase n=1 Tax=Anoxybacillus TaxID=150247 RepID=UPI001EDA5CCE|nr:MULTISPECIES: RluA family pseudouridine synthase [Anoxybacillus]MCG5025183.1 RluA family pseudouridine synthase [Anoxybacillus flavithermus]MCG6199033.1 RluA family pseudouridine synthase [Anoxybacillus sp. LAT_38]MCG3084999.1 RluA family pseudouridine synthase [Anoxybacillus sp. LAT27]MCG6171749.1 RluA family pseudouridine synthase [Anoxybacillus sp. LAT_11]MCG6174998.1 RluA family pseudouridine synthase [Anoxybacillus sp. LAT_31]